MNYEVNTTKGFEKDAKKLKKKYPSIVGEISDLISKLETKPNMGTAIENNCYKIRLSIASKGKGKSGGARVITYFYVKASSVFLLSIYDKSDQDSISKEQIENSIARLDC